MKTTILIIYILMTLSLTGCSSFAHRKYACSELPPTAVISGNILQIGDCSIFKSFKIETGDYYSNHKSSIDRDLESFPQIRIGTTESLGNFAKAFNCHDKYHRLFSERLYERKNLIFGNAVDKSPRQVSLAVQNMINQDPDLSQYCD